MRVSRLAHQEALTYKQPATSGVGPDALSGGARGAHVLPGDDEQHGVFHDVTHAVGIVPTVALHLLLQLGDGATQGKAAAPKDLVNWTKKYKVDFPSTIDPDYKLGELFAANAWPANAMIDTRTMKIFVIIAGVPDDAYWTKFEKVLKGN